MRCETRRRPGRSLPGRLLAGCLALSMLGAFPGVRAPASAVAGDAPTPHALLRGFQPTGKYVFQTKDGAKAETAPRSAPPTGAKAVPLSDRKPESKPDTKPAPKPDPKPEPKPEPKPDPKPEPQAGPAEAPTPEPGVKAEPAVKAEPGVTSDPGAAPATPPKSDPPAGATSGDGSGAPPGTAGAPRAEPPAEPAPEPKPAAPPKRKTAPNGGPLIGPDPEPAPESKPTPKPGDSPATQAAAGVYYSRRASAYLVIGSPLGHPFLVRTGMGTVESVPADALLARGDGSVDLRADVSLSSLGRFSLEDADIVLSVPGVAGRLTPPPHLLGWHTAAELLAHTPEYGRDAAGCPIDAGCVSSLRSCETEVRVVVYFGSWCSTCSQLLGRVLRLDQDIQKAAPSGTKAAIHFDYYGLPPPPATWTDPEAVLRNLDHLPTAIVFVNGACCNRIGSADLGRPDLALRAALSGR